MRYLRLIPLRSSEGDEPRTPGAVLVMLDGLAFAVVSAPAVALAWAGILLGLCAFPPWCAVFGVSPEFVFVAAT